MLEALTEVIDEKKGRSGSNAPSATEYFATILTALETSDTRSTLRELVFLLSLVLPHVPSAVIRAKFDLVGTLFQEIAGAANTLVDGSTILRHIVGSIGVLCERQAATSSVWARPSSLQVLGMLLAFCVDERPKVRRVAQIAATQLLQSHATAGFSALASPVAKFAAQVFHSDSQGEGQGEGTSATLHMIAFLRRVVPLMSASTALKVGGSWVITANVTTRRRGCTPKWNEMK